MLQRLLAEDLLRLGRLLAGDTLLATRVLTGERQARHHPYTTILHGHGAGAQVRREFREQFAADRDFQFVAQPLFLALAHIGGDLVAHLVFQFAAELLAHRAFDLHPRARRERLVARRALGLWGRPGDLGHGRAKTIVWRAAERRDRARNLAQP